jgi:hypothetical protein
MALPHGTCRVRVFLLLRKIVPMFVSCFISMRNEVCGYHQKDIPKTAVTLSPTWTRLTNNCSVLEKRSNKILNYALIEGMDANSSAINFAIFIPKCPKSTFPVLTELWPFMQYPDTFQWPYQSMTYPDSNEMKMKSAVIYAQGTHLTLQRVCGGPSWPCHWSITCSATSDAVARPLSTPSK